MKSQIINEVFRKLQSAQPLDLEVDQLVLIENGIDSTDGVIEIKVLNNGVSIGDETVNLSDFNYFNYQFLGILLDALE